MDKWTSEYQRRVNDERLVRQAPDVQGAVKDILEQLKSIDLYVYWALDPSQKDGGAYYCQNLLDHAHELVDQAHTFRAALKANPPPKENEDDENDDAA